MHDLAQRVVAGYSRRRYAILFFSLLLTIGVGPVLASAGLDLQILQLFLAANVVAAVSASDSGRARRLLLGAVIAGWCLEAAAVSLDSPTLARAAEGIPVLVALQAAAMALRHSLRAEVVESEHLYAALGAYLLFGVFFGAMFVIVHRFDPTALLDAGEPIPHLTLPDGIYFSFVTLATLGYGDILPRSELARGLAVFEAIAGQLYLAVMVARLIALYRGRGVRP